MLKLRGIELFYEGELYEVFENNVSGTGKKVMLSVLKHMEKDMNQIIVSGKTLESMMEATGMSEAQIRNGVSELKKHALIEATGDIRAEYVVNPLFAVKGDRKRVWHFYSTLEVSRGNVKATTVKPSVELDGKKLPLTEEDYKRVGEYLVRGGR